MIVDPMNAIEIGQAIRNRRRQLNLSQSSLADLASCSKPFVIAAERGKLTLRLDKLMAILEVLGLSLDVQSRKQE
jgi:y4mF family transcriptional regulator